MQQGWAVGPVLAAAVSAGVAAGDLRLRDVRAVCLSHASVREHVPRDTIRAAAVRTLERAWKRWPRRHVLPKEDFKALHRAMREHYVAAVSAEHTRRLRRLYRRAMRRFRYVGLGDDVDAAVTLRVMDAVDRRRRPPTTTQEIWCRAADSARGWLWLALGGASVYAASKVSRAAACSIAAGFVCGGAIAVDKADNAFRDNKRSQKQSKAHHAAAGSFLISLSVMLVFGVPRSAGDAVARVAGVSMASLAAESLASSLRVFGEASWRSVYQYEAEALRVLMASYPQVPLPLP
jgi:hypothetical protein